MPIRYFTEEEANNLLPQIEPVMANLIDRRGRAVRIGQELGDLLDDTFSNIGGAALSALTLEFIAIEKGIQQIQALGCLVKDINVGLVDFLANRNGRDVYLCWRYGEPDVAFYHDVHTGFNSRRPL